MTARERFSGPLTIIDEDLTLDCSILISDALLINSATLTVSHAAYATLVAGVYTPLGLVEQLGSLLRGWFYDALVGFGGIVTAPSSADELDVRIEWSPGDGVNATLARLYLGDLGDTLIGGLTPIVGNIKLLASSDVWALAGANYEQAAADRTISSLGGIVDAAGLWQPKAAFNFKRADMFRGANLRFNDYYTHRTRDGAARSGLAGSPQFDTSYRLLDQRSTIAGPLYYVGEFLSIKSGRRAFNIRAVASPAAGMLDPLYRDDMLVVGRYYLIGAGDPWLVRLQSKTPGAGLIELGIFEYLPQGLATPPVKSPVWGCSEAMALKLLAAQRGGLFVSEASISGASTFAGAIYTLDSAGALDIAPERRDAATPLYSLEFTLAVDANPDVVA